MAHLSGTSPFWLLCNSHSSCIATALDLKHIVLLSLSPSFQSSPRIVRDGSFLSLILNTMFTTEAEGQVVAGDYVGAVPT